MDIDVGRVDIYIYIYIYRNKVCRLYYDYNWVRYLVSVEVASSPRNKQLYYVYVMGSYIVSLEMENIDKV